MSVDNFLTLFLGEEHVSSELALLGRALLLRTLLLLFLGLLLLLRSLAVACRSQFRSGT